MKQQAYARDGEFGLLALFNDCRCDRTRLEVTFLRLHRCEQGLISRTCPVRKAVDDEYDSDWCGGAATTSDVLCVTGSRGRRRSITALSVIERRKMLYYVGDPVMQAIRTDLTMSIRHFQQIPPDTPYGEIVEVVRWGCEPA